MRRRVLFYRLVVLAICIFFLSGSIVPPGNTHTAAANSEPITNATWLWNTKLIETSSDELISFMDHQGIEIVFLQISRNVSKSSYTNFIKNASMHQIKVYAADGAPDWALNSKLPKLTSFMTWINNYQNSVNADEKFSGIHVDIEPYLLPEWTNNFADLVAQWQSNIIYLSTEAQQMNLPLNAALPFWMDKYKTPDQNETISYWMISKLDSISLMTYRDKANTIFNLAQSELIEAELLNKKVYICVETKPSREGNQVTFYEEGAAYMYTQLINVRSKASSYPSFAGIAVHDLGGWMNLVNNSVDLRTLPQ
ncbi:hypothetical protein D3C76_517960 [compost metagenome]